MHSIEKGELYSLNTKIQILPQKGQIKPKASEKKFWSWPNIRLASGDLKILMLLLNFIPVIEKQLPLFLAI